MPREEGPGTAEDRRAAPDLLEMNGLAACDTGFAGAMTGTLFCRMAHCGIRVVMNSLASKAPSESASTVVFGA